MTTTKTRRMGFPVLLSMLVFLAEGPPAQAAESAPEYDVVVYGATPAGITTAIAAAREGASVVLLEQTRHVGGLNTSGLNRDEAEHMDRRTLGGLSEQFTREAARRSGTNPNPRGSRVWESHVAEEVFLDMLHRAEVPVRFEQLLERVTMDGSRIESLRLRGGPTIRAKFFVDATYEGDLMAAAGVSHAVGRESRDSYNESLAGVRYRDPKIPVSPYDRQGKLLPGVMPGEPPAEDAASPIPICYNIRLNLTTEPGNRVPIEKPKNYDPRQHELLARCIEAGMITRIGEIFGLYGMPNGKRECNNRQSSIVSMSLPGEQTAWAEASFEQREAIHRKYRDYTQGMIWFLKSDPRVPVAMRRDMARYGLCADEWRDNEHWPWYLYVRAARRMKGSLVLTQHDVTEDREKADVIHVGSHFIDAHHAARYAVDREHFINEGRIWREGVLFDIPYRAITPKPRECANLLVPVCVSASHVAFCAIRVEPTWMHLGEAAGIAAAMSAASGSPVQELDVGQLQEKLKRAGIPLEVPVEPSDTSTE